MTLGPTIALMPLLDGARGAVARWLTVFGRVPFFYYVLHIPLIHVLAIDRVAVRTGSDQPVALRQPPHGAPAAARGLRMESAAALSRAGRCAMVMLYGACRWYADLKARRTDWWLRYV